MTDRLQLEDVVVRLGGRTVLDGVSLSVAPGVVVGIVGPNGAGKTTLLRAALGLQRLAAGHALIGGYDPRRLAPLELARRAGYLPQDRRLAWNLQAWRAASLGALHEPPERARQIALEALDKVGLSPLADRGVFDMSGGERARVLLARLLATRAPLLLADEATAGLDPDAQLMALELLRREASQGASVLMSLHDLSLAARGCDRLAVLDHGRIAAEGPPAVALKEEVLDKVFGLEGRLVETAAGPVLAAGRKGRAA
jgi:iron complex transport system ATP-binding protein